MIINLNLPQRSLLILCSLIAALTSIMLLLAIWQWYSDWELANQPVTQTPVITKSNATAKIIAAIPDKHLFGKSLNGNVPITNLQFRVTGIVKLNESNAANSKAYISVSGQPSKIYQTGDSLPYGVKIYAIAADNVILENDGHLEKLPLPRAKLHFKAKNIGEGYRGD